MAARWTCGWARRRIVRSEPLRKHCRRRRWHSILRTARIEWKQSLALTPALSHPMGEGDLATRFLQTSASRTFRAIVLVPSPIGWERARVRVIRFYFLEASYIHEFRA